MVIISHDSINSPLLKECNENIPNYGSTNLHRDEVVVVIPSESQDSVIANESLAKESKNTFQQKNNLNRTHSHDHLRSESRQRGHSIHNSMQKKSLAARAKYNAKVDMWSLLYNIKIGLLMWPKWSWDAMKKNRSLTIISIKQALCAGLCSILCVVNLPKPFTEVSWIAMWAVITTDVLHEENVGASIGKGWNRVLGTLVAGCLGFGLNQIGLQLGTAHPFFVVFCVVMGGFIFRFLKGIPGLKEQWSYAHTVATMAFHLFIINGYQDPGRWTLPMLRFSMILLGFVVSLMFIMSFCPIYAGDALHKLVAKNFETTASVFERCVEGYIKDTKLDHVQDTLNGQCEDDRIPQSNHKRVMSDSDIDKLVSVDELFTQLVITDTHMEKLLSVVLWEPPHGNFFKGYPWHLYDDIVDCLRYTLYDIIALKLCLRGNIQAPKHLKDIFAQEMTTIATECATVLRTLGDSIKNMKKFSSENIMARAEEVAVELQSKIHQNIDILLGSTIDGPNHFLLETPPNSQASDYQPILDQDDLISTNNKGTNKLWKNINLYKKSNLGPHGDDILERISALSLVEFASLLIKVVSKMRFVVDCVENFSEQAKFQAC